MRKVQRIYTEQLSQNSHKPVFTIFLYKKALLKKIKKPSVCRAFLKPIKV